jgi:hypothetical protein
MKRIALLAVAATSIATVLTARADAPVFGNSPDGDNGFALSVYNGLALSGGAIEFTPTSNINLSSATLWLSGYTGQYGQSIYANIYNSSSAQQPYAPYLSLGTAAHNDGSLAAFTFSSLSANPYNDPSGSTVLSANTAYWLVVTAGGSAGDYMAGANWVGGNTPGGLAIYNGSDNYNVYGASFSPGSTLPAFTLNESTFFIQEVPEPGSFSLIAIPALLLLGRALVSSRKK